MPLNQHLKKISQCNNSLISYAAYEAWYDSQLGQQLASLTFLIVFFGPSRQVMAHYYKLCPDCFL
jgi:hypothetical protein